MSSISCEQRLTGALIGLARATDGNEHLISESSAAVIVESLANWDADDAVLEKLLVRVEEEKRKMVPNCFHCANPCGKNSDFDMARLQHADPDIRSLKLQILDRIRSAAANLAGSHDEAAERLLYKALIVIGLEDYGTKDLLTFAREAEKFLPRAEA